MKCKYKDECRTRQLYWDLCMLNMSWEERRAIGNKCPIAEEYGELERKVEDLERSHLLPNLDYTPKIYIKGKSV